MIDSIAQWFLFLLWNLPLFFLGFMLFPALFAWPFSVVYATFGIIFFPFLDTKKLKKMRIERKIPDLNFRTSPLNISVWEFWQRAELSKNLGKLFLFTIAAWLILMFFVHFLMAHVFGYPPAQQASHMTEAMFGFLSPYSNEVTLFNRILALSIIPVIIFNFSGPYFTEKVRKFIWEELRYDWFKNFITHKKRQEWIDFGKEYMLLYLPEHETFQKGEHPKYQSSFKIIRWKRNDYYSSDETDIKEDKFNLYHSFEWKVRGGEEPSGISLYPFKYQVYPYDTGSESRRKEIRREAKALIFHFDYEKVLDIYLQMGLEKGYIEEFTNQNGQQALRLTAVENKADTSQEK